MTSSGPINYPNELIGSIPVGGIGYNKLVERNSADGDACNKLIEGTSAHGDGYNKLIGQYSGSQTVAIAV